MGFIYDICHAAAAENITVYIIVLYWTSCSADCWPKVAFQMYGLGSGACSSACVLYREVINYFAIRISWWPIRISNLKFLINYN